VRRRQRLCHADEDIDALLHRDIADPADFLRPLAQVSLRREIAFEEEWRLVELYLVQAHNVFAIAERRLDQAEDRQFAFERPQPLGIEAKLENVARFRGLMLREPHLAETAFADLSFEQPVGPTGHGHSNRRPPA
jgi:hypothetical protein